MRNLSLDLLGIMRSRVVSQNKWRPTINTMGRRILVLSMVLASTTSIAAPAVQQGDEYARWPVGKKPFWDEHKVPESLCDLNKEIISFSCRLANDKLVSVCASRDLGPDAGYIVYRYGLSDKVEMIYPTTTQEPQPIFWYSNDSMKHVHQLGSQLSLSFVNKPYRYTVFSHRYMLNNNQREINRAGISVTEGTHIVFQKLCNGGFFYTTSRIFYTTTRLLHHDNFKTYGEYFLFDTDNPWAPTLNLKEDQFTDYREPHESDH